MHVLGWLISAVAFMSSGLSAWAYEIEPLGDDKRVEHAVLIDDNPGVVYLGNYSDHTTYFVPVVTFRNCMVYMTEERTTPCGEMGRDIVLPPRTRVGFSIGDGDNVDWAEAQDAAGTRAEIYWPASAEQIAAAANRDSASEGKDPGVKSWVADDGPLGLKQIHFKNYSKKLAYQIVDFVVFDCQNLFITICGAQQGEFLRPGQEWSFVINVQDTAKPSSFNYRADYDLIP